MKLTVDAGVLSPAFKKVASVIERQNTIPILSNVLLSADAKAGTLSLTGTDLDLVISISVPASVDKSGTTTAPATMLEHYIAKLPKAAALSFDDLSDKGRLTVSVGRSRISLQTLSAEDFPDFAVGDLSHSFSLTWASLLELFGMPKFAISTEATRYYLNGIYLHEVASGPLLRAVATDGHRLAQAQIVRPAGAAGMPGVIVPRKTVLTAIKIFEKAEAVVVSLSTQKIRMQVEQTVLTSKLIDGTFPDYERVIPQRGNMIAIMKRAEIATVVDRVSTISLEKGRGIALQFQNGKVNAEMVAAEAGRASEEMAIDYEGSDISVGLNSRYLLDSLAALEGDDISMTIEDAGSPVVFRDPAATNRLIILMPMRI